MSDDQKTKAEETVEEHVGVTQPDAFEQTTTGERVTGRRLYADGGHGQEKETTSLSRHAGASSDAPASSGIPSAERQHGVGDATAEQEETPMGDRVQSARSSREP